MRGGALVVLVCAACGSAKPAAPTHARASRLDVLGGELVVAPVTVAARIQPNRPDSIMAAAESPTDATVVRLDDGAFHGVAVFRREWLACTGDGEAAARAFANDAKLGEIAIEHVGASTLAVLPKQPTTQDGQLEVGFVTVCAGASGLLSAHVIGEGDASHGRPVLMDLAHTTTIAKPADHAARTVTLAACGQTVKLSLPDGFLASTDYGADFDVHHFRRLDGAGLSFYLGSSPHPFAPADATQLDVSGVSVARWQDADGVHLERLLHSGECAVHAFALAPPAAEADLRTLIAFPFKADR